MKKLETLVIVLLALPSALFAQPESQPELHREAGVRFFTLENFDLAYKIETRPNRYFRINLVLADLELSTQQGNPWQVGVGAGVGWERRAALSDRLWFIHGPQVQLTADFLSATNSQGETFFNTGLNGRLAYMIGLQYDLNERFYVNIELQPSVRMGTLIREQSGENTTFAMGFNTNRVGVTVAHRFARRLRPRS